MNDGYIWPSTGYGNRIINQMVQILKGAKEAKRSKSTQRARLCIVCHGRVPSHQYLMSINDFILYILISICRNIVVYGQTWR